METKKNNLKIKSAVILFTIFVTIVINLLLYFYPSRKYGVILNNYVFIPLFIISLILSINILYKYFYLKERLNKWHVLIAFLPLLFIIKIISSIWF